jgi:hypothetical protein
MIVFNTVADEAAVRSLEKITLNVYFMKGILCNLNERELVSCEHVLSFSRD